MSGPDLKIVEYDSNSHCKAVTGGWCEGRFYCEVELTYDNDGSELWLTVEGVRSPCGEWTMQYCDLRQVDVVVRGRLVRCTPQGMIDCPGGEWFFDHEIVREAMERCYQADLENAKEANAPGMIEARRLGVD
jgi:hypothetical protein